MIIGSNAAENHPVSFKWVLRAMDKGAKLISVDPRFTRTSSKADIYAPLRSGTDIAFVGGMINYVLQKKLYHEEYVANYTNAGFLVNKHFDFDQAEGLFTGFDKKSKTYANKKSWQYQTDEKGVPIIDRTLKHPNCVFQLLKKHFSRYDADTACRVTGTPREVFDEVCRTYSQTGQRGMAGTIMYAMGTTQHTHGTQNIRSYAILQLLLGNMGVAGGGINALRGESNVQGSTDHCLLFHIIPGYLKCPVEADQGLQAYIDHWTPKSADTKSANWWQHTPKYIVSLLKAFYGDAATKKNDFCYNYLPKRDGGANYSHMSLFEAMYKGDIKGFMVWGQNPAVGGPNAKREREALEKLDWMVAVDLWETETAAFWKKTEDNPKIDPSKINTEVFLLPAAASYEKEGSITNSGRWAQWRYKAVDPVGESMEDLWILDQLAKELKKLYKKGGTFPDPIVNMMWDYGEHPDPHAVAREINGYAMADFKSPKGKDIKKGEQIPSFAHLSDKGASCSGNWLYCGSYIGPNKEDNMMARRDPTDAENKIGLFPKWAWCWPVNRRIIYNRASCDPAGKPWNTKRWVVWWEKDGAGTKWGKGDVPDGGWAPDAKYAFIMKPEGHARIFGMGRADGPLPEHYEPMESPAKNPFSGSQNTPAVYIYAGECRKGECPPDTFATKDKFPIVCTTYRVSEHWQAGMMTRNLPWLNELMPEPFVEMSEELARAKGISSGDEVKVITIRNTIKLKAAVTKRFKPFVINGETVHQVGVIWHWGYCGGSRGASANLLTPQVGDVNTRIPEFKAFLCDIKKAT
jgi:formate dehydrogenase major subunit